MDLKKYPLGIDHFCLVTDMDGTLLNSEHRVSEKNARAIQNFVNAGGKFTIATGRMPSNALDYVKMLPMQIPAIFYNGALLADANGKTLCTKELEGNLWRDFARHLLKKYPTICIEVYDEEHCYILSDPQYDDIRLASEYNAYQHISMDNILDCHWLKLFLCASPDLLKIIAQKDAPAFGIDKCSNYFFSAENYLEFVHREASKGHMLHPLKKYGNIEDCILLAAGDFANDCEMLRRAEIGIASGNASEDAKAAADIVGPNCDEDLIAWILEDLLPQIREH